jgi:predicted nucleic acid-binding protein
MNFLDTNLLMYAEDGRFRAKQKVARDLLRGEFHAGTGVISAQVLDEFYVNAQRKLGASRAQARARAKYYAELQVVPVTAELALAAIDLHQIEQISFWDALIVAAARASGCGRLYSEDLQHGATYDGVRVENPFLEASR